MISFQSKGSNYRGEIYAPIQARPGHHEFKIMRVVQTNWNQFECFKTFSSESDLKKSLSHHLLGTEVISLPR